MQVYFEKKIIIYDEYVLHIHKNQWALKPRLDKLSIRAKRSCEKYAMLFLFSYSGLSRPKKNSLM